MPLNFHTLDVFTERRFAGNPLAVVHDADELSNDRMQAIAREFNLAETVFLARPVNPAHTARVRIFTPAMELPFAGHPTIGTAILLADRNAPEGANSHDAIIALEQNIGLVRVGVRLRAGRAPYAEFDVPKLPEEVGPAPPVERLAAAVSLLRSEVGFANHRPLVLSAGMPFHFVPVASLDAIGKASPNMQHWTAAFGAGRGGMALLYCRETVHNKSSFHARMFAPSSGIPEDPATGSAVAALGAAILQFDALPDGSYRRVIEQGYEMGRPSELLLSIEIERGTLKSVRIGGSAVRVSEGTLQV
jgi:trans-2,3-dihydro-3-hydroxyanthranilate isomerase